MSDELAAIRPQVYRDERPAEYFAPFYRRAQTRDPNWVYEIVRILTCLYAWAFFRLRAVRAELAPSSGPVIIAPNHFSFMDHFFVGDLLRRRLHFMAKSQLFKPPMQWIYSHGGVFPVRRGHRDEEAFHTANAILARGGAIVMYCEGGRSRSATLADTAKPGIGRIALQSGATVVPAAIHGSSHVRNWRRGRFPKVTVLFGEPIRWERVEEPTRAQQQQVANEIFAQIRGLYAELDAHGRRGVVRALRRTRGGAGGGAAVIG